MLVMVVVVVVVVVRVLVMLVVVVVEVVMVVAVIVAVVMVVKNALPLSSWRPAPGDGDRESIMRSDEHAFSTRSRTRTSRRLVCHQW